MQRQLNRLNSIAVIATVKNAKLHFSSENGNGTCLAVDDNGILFAVKLSEIFSQVVPLQILSELHPPQSMSFPHPSLLTPHIVVGSRHSVSVRTHGLTFTQQPPIQDSLLLQVTEHRASAVMILSALVNRNG